VRTVTRWASSGGRFPAHAPAGGVRPTTRTVTRGPSVGGDSLSAVATQDDVRRIALGLPETSEVDGRFAFSVLNKGKRKDFVWVWQERVNPKKPRVANPAVLAVRVADQLEKDVILRSDDAKFFTEPHYDGFPAVLVRLAAVGAGELEELVTNAWRYQAPRQLRESYDRSHPAADRNT
jgi:hypothetical protein